MPQVMEAQVVNLQKVTSSGKCRTDGLTVIREYFLFYLRLALNDAPGRIRQKDPRIYLLPRVLHIPN